MTSLMLTGRFECKHQGAQTEMCGDAASLAGGQATRFSLADEGE